MNDNINKKVSSQVSCYKLNSLNTQIKLNKNAKLLLGIIIAFLLLSISMLYYFTKPVQVQKLIDTPTNTGFIASADTSTYTDTTNNIVYTYTPNYSLTIDGTTYTGIQINNINIPSSYTSTTYTIPNTITHNSITYPVIDIGSNLSNVSVFQNSATNFTTLVIPANIVSISYHSLKGCGFIQNINFADNSNLLQLGTECFYSCKFTQIIFPDTLKIISNNVFQYCYSLTKIVIPKSVKSIDQHMAYSCTALKEIEVDSLNQNYKAFNNVLYSLDGYGEINSLVCYPPGLKTSYYALETGTRGMSSGCLSTSSIDHLHITDTVNNIHGNAFSSISVLKKISVSNNNGYYKSIDDVLYNKDGTSLIYYPKSKTGEYYRLPKSVTNVGNALPAAQYLKWLDVENGNTSFKSLAGVLFSADGKQLIFYPKSNNITNYTVPYGVEEICSNSMSGNKALINLVLPNTIKKISQYALVECTNLVSVTILSNVVSIAYGAFQHCHKLETITLPATLEYIGNLAFSSCYNLKKIYILGEDITKINFSGTAIFNGISSDAEFYFADTSANVSEWLNGKPLTNVSTVTYNYSDSAENPVIVNNITLNANDGNNTTDIIQACDNQQFIFPVAEREGYIFTGWYTTSACTTQVATLYGVMNNSVTNYTDSNGAWIGGAKTLYAGWVEIIDLTLQITNNYTNQSYDGYFIIQIGDYVSMIGLPRGTSKEYTFKGVTAGDVRISIKMAGNFIVNSDKLVVSDNQRNCFATIMESSTITLTLSNA